MDADNLVNTEWIALKFRKIFDMNQETVCEELGTKSFITWEVNVTGHISGAAYFGLSFFSNQNLMAPAAFLYATEIRRANNFQ